MTRIEYLEWAKKRALEYVQIGDLDQAFASMVSDLGKHEELSNHTGIQLGVMLLCGGRLNSKRDMESFIRGFN